MLSQEQNSSILARLLQAKAFSDRRMYAQKARILQELLRERPEEFVIDSDRGNTVGLTHQASGFQVHLPRTALPSVFIQTGRSQWPVLNELKQTLANSGPLLQSLGRKTASVSLPQDLYFDLDSGEFSHTQELPPGYFDRPWVLIKKAYSPTLRGLTDLMALTPGTANRWYGGPRPLAATLAGGMLGAGAGYLGGALAEGLGGDLLQKNRLRKTLAVLGGLAGATPGLLWGGYNLAKGVPGGILSSSPHSGPGSDQPDPGLYPVPSQDTLDPRKVEADREPMEIQATWNIKEATEVLKLALPEYIPEFLKSADPAFLAGGGGDLPPVDVDDFNQVVWSRHDPFTPIPVRAGVTGLVEAAGMMRNSPMVGVGDITRVAVGMGTGYVAGSIAGRALGALAGLSPTAQQSLQRAGTWAGVLKAITPLVYPQ